MIHAPRLPLVAVLLCVFVGSAHADGDPKKGQRLFGRCKICHQAGEGAKHSVGPALNGVFGAQAGTREGYSYSSQMKEAGENGLDWDEENLSGFLEDSQKFFPGNKHIVAPMNSKDREDVIAYLKTL